MEAQLDRPSITEAKAAKRADSGPELTFDIRAKQIGMLAFSVLFFVAPFVSIPAEGWNIAFPLLWYGFLVWWCYAILKSTSVHASIDRSAGTAKILTTNLLGFSEHRVEPLSEIEAVEMYSEKDSDGDACWFARLRLRSSETIYLGQLGSREELIDKIGRFSAKAKLTCTWA